MLASYVRLADEDSAAEADAAVFRQDSPAAARIAEFLTTRAFNATNRDDVRVETELQLKNLIDAWDAWATDDDPKLVYTRFGIGNAKSGPAKLNLLRSMERRGGSLPSLVPAS